MIMRKTRQHLLDLGINTGEKYPLLITIEGSLEIQEVPHNQKMSSNKLNTTGRPESYYNYDTI